MLQNIEDYWFVYIITYIMLGAFWIMRGEKENDILGKKFHKKMCGGLPITIEYKGRKLTIDRKEEIFKCGYFDCRWDERTPKKYTYFINDNPIACITVIKYTIWYHYFTMLNHEYNVSDFKGILNEAIKEKKRQDKIRFNKNSEDNRKKLYELVSQEDSANGERQTNTV